MSDTEDKRFKHPEHWTWTPLGELGEWGSGGTPKSDNDAYYGGSIPWLKIGDLNNGLVSQSAEKITQKGLKESAAKLVPEDALLVAMYGSIGKLVITGFECATNQAIAYCIPNTNSASLKFLFWALQFYQTDLIESGKGGVQKNISQTVLKNFEIPLPPLSEQHRIVAKIEELFSNLDAGMADLQAAGQQLERYRLSVLQAAVEGRLTADWRRTHDPEPADQLLDQIGEQRRAGWEERYRWNRYESKGKEPPSGWKSRYKTPEQPESNDKELPTTWSWATVQQVSFVGTGATPKRGNPDFWDGGKIPWVTSGALNAQYVEEAEECITEEALEETSCEVFPKHSLLIAMYGEGKTRGKVAELMIEAATNQACAAVEVVGDKPALREYLKVYFQKNYHDIRRQAAGGVQPNLNLGIIRGINFPLPPLAEQKQIVGKVERLLSVANDAAATADREQTRAERLRQSILKQAFNGQFVPHEEAATPPAIESSPSDGSPSSASGDTGSSSDEDDVIAEELYNGGDPGKQIEMDL